MKRTFLILVLMVLYSCGNSNNRRVSLKDFKYDENDGYIPVARAIITISTQEELAYQKIFNSLSPITLAYAASTTTSIVYTASEVGTISLDITNLTTSEVSDTLELGSISVNDLKVNKLKICGVGGNQKCTSAIIRVYTQELLSFPGISGFVNTDDGYGVDVFAGKPDADQLVGLTSINSAIVQEYIIPSNDNKLTLSDFPSPTYQLESDFSNAGAGDYEMTLVVEVALGL